MARSALAAASCVLLLGCVAIPPRPIDANTRAQALVARHFSDAELQRFARDVLGVELPAPTAAWDTPALEAAAFYWNPRVASAAAALRGAQSAIESARALPNPTLSIMPEYSANPARGESPWSPALQLEWPIATAGKRSDAIDRATAEALAAHHAFAAEVAATARDVGLARIELTAAQDAARASEGEAQVARELARAWRTRVELGAASRAQASPAAAAAFSADSELAAAKARALTARAGLATALGIPSARLDEIALAPVASDDAVGDTETDLASALVGRADVLAALARYAATEAALQGEVAKQFPDLRIGSGYQWDQGQSKFLLGLSADLPILDHNAGPIAEAVAARERAAAEFDTVQSAALAEIETARADADTARERRETLRASASALEAQAARTDAALAAGASNRVDALADRALALRAQRELREAELALGAAELRLAGAVAPVRAELGPLEQWFAKREGMR